MASITWANASATPLVSFGTRFEARLVNATHRPFALIEGQNDPANAAVRGRMLDEFWQMAVAIGEAQRILERLSRSQKQEIAASAGVAFRQLPADQRQEALDLLRTSQAPIPQDLNAMLLREFGDR